MKDAVFYLGLGALFTHELDAMPNGEWRVLPLLRALPDDLGMLVFVILHVPLYAVAVALVASLNRRTRLVARSVLAAFLVVHALLHALFSGHGAYAFSGVLSNGLIYGGAACGALWLTLEFVSRPAWTER